jgi:hypothetical protein
MGYSASMRLRDEDGNQYFRPNQELSIDKKNATPYAQGDELATIDDKGHRKVIATWDDATKAFKLSADLRPEEVEEYMGKKEAQQQTLDVQARAKELRTADPSLSEADALKEARRDYLNQQADSYVDEEQRAAERRAAAFNHYAA